MRSRYSMVFVLSLLCVVAAPSALLAQDEQPQKRKFSSLLNVDSLIDNYARFLARKYDLDEQQDEFTQSLLRQKAQKFLGQNEHEMFDLVDRMFEVRTGGAMDEVELVEWGKRVMPMYEQAKAIIIDGNNEWRTILNDRQRAMHDADLKLMEESFRATDDQIRRIVQGEMSVEEFRNPARYQRQKNREAPPPPPPPQPVQEPLPQNGAPPGDHPMEPIPQEAPPKTGDGSETHMPEPEAGQPQHDEEAPAPIEHHAKEHPVEHHEEQPVIEHQPQHENPDAAAVREQIRKAAAAGNKETQAPQPARVSKTFNTEWENYVRQFIERYKLTAEQAQKAQDILKDCEQQAERLLRSRESRLSDLEKREAQLRTSKDKNASKELAKINDDRQKLLAPIGDIFEKQLKPKLDRLPTSRQRKEAEAAAKNPPKAPAANTTSGKPGPASAGGSKKPANAQPRAGRNNAKPQPQGAPQPANPPAEEPAMPEPPTDEQPPVDPPPPPQEGEEQPR